jgi:hypothetical protein
MVDAERPDPDQHFPLAGDRIGNLLDLQYLGATGLGDHNRAHPGFLSTGRQTHVV